MSTSQRIVFESMPKTLEEMQRLPQAALKTPHDTAALTVAALCRYAEDKGTCYAMLNFLKGPEPLTPYDKQFLADRLRDKAYLPLSFFSGATPANGYAPTQPYTLDITENAYSYVDASYAKLFIQSGGADSPRPIILREKPSTGQWFLNSHMLLAGIRVPEAQDPWA